MDVLIAPASTAETAVVSEVLWEAASWLQRRGMPLWRRADVEPTAIEADVSSGYYFLARVGGKPAATFKYQPEDPVTWPDAVPGEASYIHRIAILRIYAGGVVSSKLLQWAAARARAEGKAFLRLDCDSVRPRLRAMYEQFGFVHHSDRQVGPFHVARYQLLASSAAA